MSWMDLFKKSVALPSAEKVPLDRLEIPLLPLAAVLFPGGVLSLKLSEQRYLKMAAACMESRAPFGVCLVLGGKEAGQGVQPHKVGTLAYIDRGDLPPSDVLSVNIRGGRRFRILSQVLGDDGLLRAQVELLLEPERREVPVDQRGLLPLLRKVVGDLGVEKIPEPHDFDDAAWVGYRLTEVVPVQLLAKQKLLELDDSVSRLEILFAYLSQRKLLL